MINDGKKECCDVCGCSIADAELIYEWEPGTTCEACYLQSREVSDGKGGVVMSYVLTFCDNCGCEVIVEETHGCECGATLCPECICEDCESLK